MQILGTKFRLLDLITCTFTCSVIFPSPLFILFWGWLSLTCLGWPDLHLQSIVSLGYQSFYLTLLNSCDYKCRSVQFLHVCGCVWKWFLETLIALIVNLSVTMAKNHRQESGKMSRWRSILSNIFRSAEAIPRIYKWKRKERPELVIGQREGDWKNPRTWAWRHKSFQMLKTPRKAMLAHSPWRERRVLAL